MNKDWAMGRAAAEADKANGRYNPNQYNHSHINTDFMSGYLGTSPDGPHDNGQARFPWHDLNATHRLNCGNPPGHLHDPSCLVPVSPSSHVDMVSPSVWIEGPPPVVEVTTCPACNNPAHMMAYRPYCSIRCEESAKGKHETGADMRRGIY